MAIGRASSSISSSALWWRCGYTLLGIGAAQQEVTVGRFPQEKGGIVTDLGRGYGYDVVLANDGASNLSHQTGH